MTPSLPAWQAMLVFALPLTLAVVVAAKASRGWTAALAAFPAWAKPLVLVAFGTIVIYGGSKPGPTLSNWRVLMAERSGKLSSGAAFGPKGQVVEAWGSAAFATGVVASASVELPAMSNSLAQSSAAASAARDEPRHYLRLRFPSPEIAADANLYGEIRRHETTNGTVSAYVWFNVVPNVEPGMRFTFASGSPTNRLATVAPSSSSWPDTVDVAGYDCVRYDVPIPAALLSAGDALRSPLDVEARVALGCPESAEPFDVRGDVVLKIGEAYWATVTGYRTNATGTVLYFYKGRLATPTTIQGANNEEEM